MHDLTAQSDYDLIRSLPFPYDRTPEPQDGRLLPSDTVVVSADSHWSIAEDIWYEAFPGRLKDKAPRVWRENGVCHIGFDGKSLFPPLMEKSFALFEPVPGCYDLDARIAALDAEGIDKEMIFGNGVNALLRHEDLELREWIFRTYNEYLAKLGERAPNRFYGVATPNFWDVSKIEQSLAEIKALGLRTIFLPMKPGRNPAGADIVYNDEEMDPFWDAIEESGLPVCFHVGENVPDGKRGMLGIGFFLNLSPFRKTVGELIFGGILDRHPRLQIVFVEAGLNWIANARQDVELVHASFGTSLDWELQHEPRYYFDTYFYSTFMTDEIGLRMLDDIGPDRVLWTSDFPHAESTYGYSWTAMNAVVDATTPENARKILGGTAIKLFGLD